MRDATYPPIIVTAKTAFRALGQRFQMTGTEHVPARAASCWPSTTSATSTSSTAGSPRTRRDAWSASCPSGSSSTTGGSVRSCARSTTSRSTAARAWRASTPPSTTSKRGEAVGIFPEATISRSMELKEFKSGAVRIAAEAGVPLVPVILWGTQRMMTKDHPRDFSRGTTIAISVGEPMHVTGEDAVAETAELRRRMAAMLAEVVADYPADEQPPGPGGCRRRWAARPRRPRRRSPSTPPRSGSAHASGPRSARSDKATVDLSTGRSVGLSTYHRGRVVGERQRAGARDSPTAGFERCAAFVPQAPAYSIWPSPRADLVPRSALPLRSGGRPGCAGPSRRRSGAGPRGWRTRR